MSARLGKPKVGMAARNAERRTSPPPLPAFLVEMYGGRASDNDNLLPESEPGPAAELDCLRGVLAPELLRWAATRSTAIALGADQVLIRHGLIGEDAYLERLAAKTGVARETFASAQRSDCPLRDDQLHRAAQQGVVPLRLDGNLVWVIAPRGFTARRLCRFAAVFPDHRHRIRMASANDIARFLLEETAAPMAVAAADGLHDRYPALSAAPRKRSINRILQPIGGVIAFASMVLLLPELFGLCLALCFLAFIALRLFASVLPRPVPQRLPRLKDAELPTYTILVALHREASSVAPLIETFNAFDYPREKLEIILAVEPNDLETRAAIARLAPQPNLRTVIAPNYGPQTKPKALNFALPFARGTFLAVFDAEDRPEPGQLRAALDAFRRHGPELACAQASLCIDNPDDSWLSRMFTAEYAGQFDVFLQGMSLLNLPIPLGGSSNHFRLEALREVGAWDAFNVTEDADLGFRFARFGYRSVMFASTTYEEAPARFGGWLRQRSRWMKGWMQTWLVHMRSPRTLWRDAGPGGFVTLNLIVGGNVLTALAHPFLVGSVALTLGAKALGFSAAFLSGRFAAIHLLAIVLGYLTAAMVGLAGLARRNLLQSSGVLLLMPFYWVCLSIAAWRALYQLITEPHRWEKTEHGLARSARFTGRMPSGQTTSSLRGAERRSNPR